MFYSDNLGDWLKYLESLHPKLIDLGLERISQLAQRAKLSRFNCPVVTVAGTNGKGSCMHCLESIYTQAGYKVGTYTSPHLIRFNERIRINSKEVSDVDLVAAFKEIEYLRQSQPLTFFEFTTLAALWLYKKEPLDVLLLEIGLGGRLDAVNVVDADVAVITGIDFDHTALLGDTREKIAFEKAGIFRKNQIVVCGDVDPPASIMQQALKVAVSALYQYGQDFESESLPDGLWNFKCNTESYAHLPRVAIKQQNAATSLMVVQSLSERLPVTRREIDAGLLQLLVPGRFEQVSSPVPCILDVAHNPQAARYLASRLSELKINGQCIAVIGMLADKDVLGTIAPLIPLIDAWFVADLNVPRGSTAEKLICQLAAAGAKKCYNFTSVEQAFQAALQAAVQETGEKLLVVYGSFYTVAAVKQCLESILLFPADGKMKTRLN